MGSPTGLFPLTYPEVCVMCWLMAHGFGLMLGVYGFGFERRVEIEFRELLVNPTSTRTVALGFRVTSSSL